MSSHPITLLPWIFIIYIYFATGTIGQALLTLQLSVHGIRYILQLGLPCFNNRVYCSQWKQPDQYLEVTSTFEKTYM